LAWQAAVVEAAEVEAEVAPEAVVSVFEVAEVGLSVLEELVQTLLVQVSPVAQPPV